MRGDSQNFWRFGFWTGLIGFVLGAFVFGYLAGAKKGAMAPPDAPEVSPGHVHGKKADQENVIWTCSMHPQIRLPQPGKCPICFMDLIPVKEDAASGEAEAVSLRQITLSPQGRRLAQVAVQPVERKSVSVETRVFGEVDYDETKLGYITAWMAGRIDRLYVDFTGSTVKRGQAMASIYSPDLLTAQAELIQALASIEEIEKSGLKLIRDTAIRTEQAAREKLRLLGFSKQQIEDVIKKGTPSDHITLHSPMGGVVIHKDVLEGMYVETGTRIYTIADLSQVWVILEAYESDLPWTKLGEHVYFQTEAFPGETFKGRIVFVDPVVNEKTRTIRVRLQVPNPGMKLKPGMFVRAVYHMELEGEGKLLVIPASAPLITGKRAVVYVQRPEKEGVYEGREVVLGPRAGNSYVVKHGLSEGELVVTRGNFKIDSAVQIRAKPSMMNPQGVVPAGVHQRDRGMPDPGKISGQGPSSFEVPHSVGSAILDLMEDYENIEKAVHGFDLEDMRSAYSAFYQRLKRIDATSLTGSAALTWKESTMLLGNDAFLGAQSDTPEEAVRLLKTLSEHFDRFKAAFHVERVIESGKAVEEVPMTFKDQLGEVLDFYVRIHASLARDDFESSKVEAGEIARAVREVSMGVLEGEAHHVWMEALRQMEEGIGKMTVAKDIEEARAGFQYLSTGMKEAVKGLGAHTEGPVFELFCSMAFENKRAIWLQQQEEVLNPYFGPAMLRCGEVREKIKGK
jgi:Cu(I)/Ag(I) efflux system membrane fusion protein